MKKLIAAVSFFLVATTATANAQAATEEAAKVINVKTPEIRLVKTSSTMAEGFMDFVNNGTQAHTLVNAYTPVDEETVLHKTIMQNGKPEMVRINRITIPAKKQEDLQFNGVHIMLMNLDQTLKSNATIPLTLIFEDGSALVVPAKLVNG